MMTVTLEEVIAMNGLLDQKAIEGIIMKPSQLPEEERLRQVNESFTKKEFIIDGKLTDKFMVTAELLRRYKGSKHKIFINQLRMALVDDNFAIVLELLPDDKISISYVPQITVVKKYIEASDFLKKAQKKKFFPYEKVACTVAEYEADLDRKEWTSLMVIQVYKNVRMKSYLTYYFDEEEAYCFDHIEKTKQERGANDFRIDLAKLFEEGEADEQDVEFDD